MRKYAYIFGFLTLILSVNAVQAQATSDVDLARHYYQNADYEKALMYYEKLYESNPKNSYFFQYYLECLIKTEDYKTAEKTAKKAIKNQPDNLVLYVNLANVYQAQNDLAEVDNTYREAIKSISGNTPYNAINSLAIGLANNGAYDYALEAYQKAKKTHPYNGEIDHRIARIYSLKGDNEKMIESYLYLAVNQYNYINTVKNQLSQSLGFDDEDYSNAELLRVALLKRVQKHPEERVYNELLIWYFVQMKEFDAAFVHVKSFDKKQRANGYVVLDFGRVCTSNKAYKTAIKAFDYVIDIGKEGSFYQSAVVERLRTLNLKLIHENEYKKEDLLTLKKDYLTTLDFVGQSIISVPLRIDFAKLLAFHLHNADTAARVLQSTLELKNIKPNDVADVKMALADVYLLAGNVWDANLLYAQVEKQYKNEPIGHEAKFRKAKTFYYEGDFSLAQSQLDVLKTSTSKLIANDAFELSLLITDNLNLDTTLINMERFARAELLMYQNKDEKALKIFDSINNSVVYHSLNDEILYRRYQIAYKHRNYDKAEQYLSKIVADYADDILADNALFKLGELYEMHLNDKAKAADYYKQILFNYSGSLFTVEARKRYRKLAEEL